MVGKSPNLLAVDSSVRQTALAVMQLCGPTEKQAMQVASNNPDVLQLDWLAVPPLANRLALQRCLQLTAGQVYERLAAYVVGKLQALNGWQAGCCSCGSTARSTCLWQISGRRCSTGGASTAFGQAGGQRVSRRSSACVMSPTLPVCRRCRLQAGCQRCRPSRRGWSPTQPGRSCRRQQLLSRRGWCRCCRGSCRRRQRSGDRQQGRARKILRSEGGRFQCVP